MSEHGLTDVRMPTLDGLAATARLRALAWKGRIVALTGLASAEDRQRCLDAGCDNSMSKPFSPQDLVETLFQYLRPQG